MAELTKSTLNRLFVIFIGATLVASWVGVPDGAAVVLGVVVAGVLALIAGFSGEFDK